jgi:hypothetical protein
MRAEIAGKGQKQVAMVNAVLTVGSSLNAEGVACWNS